MTFRPSAVAGLPLWHRIGDAFLCALLARGDDFACMAHGTGVASLRPCVESNFFRRVLHRWFIEYNPLYVASAACVLIGVNLISCELVRRGTSYGVIGVAAVAEVYAWALIGAAAWLTRIGSRRPAVMLSLLVALYQCDVTLHTETSVYLGLGGVVASGAWFASFVAKLYALAWAVRLRLSASAIAIPTLGALGLSVLPWHFRELEAPATTALVVSWLFGLVALGFWSSHEVKSKVPLDSWGHTVLRRSVRATWALWALLTVYRVDFWSDEFDLDLSLLMPIALLLSTRWLRREASVWCCVAATLLFVIWRMPGFFSLTALLAAVVLSLRALREPSYRPPATDPSEPSTPYRTHPGVLLLEYASPVVSFARAEGPALVRLATGALFGLYLSAWSRGWSGGPWPAHELVLDLLLTAALGLTFRKARAYAPVVPLAWTYVHLAVQAEIIPIPDSPFESGVAFVSMGFALLAASLTSSWYHRPAPPGVAAGGLNGVQSDLTRQ